MAAHLLAQMQHDLKTRYGCQQPDHALLMGLQRTSRHMVGPYLKQRTGGPGSSQVGAFRSDMVRVGALGGGA
jgi:predicted transcriptional regulator